MTLSGSSNTGCGWGRKEQEPSNNLNEAQCQELTRWTDWNRQAYIIVGFRADDWSYCESSIVGMWFKNNKHLDGSRLWEKRRCWKVGLHKALFQSTYIVLIIPCRVGKVTAMIWSLFKMNSVPAEYLSWCEAEESRASGSFSVSVTAYTPLK